MKVKLNKFFVRVSHLDIFTILIIFLVSAQSIHASGRESIIQGSVSGSIINENNAGIPFANVLLLNATDSCFVKGSITDKTGNYSISDVDPGSYLILSHVIGYNKNYSSVFQVLENDIAIRPIRLSESVQELDEVTVQAEKPLYEQTIDRMIINVDKSPVSAGSTVLEVLERSPGVLVNRMSNSISISGKSGVNVMINGKMSRMSADALYSFLESTPSQNVEKIELITTPPANFDAEGNAGFINIVLKRNDNLGVNGSFTATVGHGRKEKLQSGGSINYRTEKLNLFSNYGFNHNRMKNIAEMQSEIRNQQYAFSSNSATTMVGGFDMSSIRMGADYYVSSKTIVGVLGDLYFRNWNGVTETNSFYDVNPGVDSLVLGRRDNHNPRLFSVLNFNVSHEFNKLQKLDINIDHLVFTNDQDQYYGNEFIPQNNTPSTVEDIRVTKVNPTRFWVGKIDYSLNVGENVKYETGVKATLNSLENDIDTDRLVDNSFVDDPFFTFYNRVNEDIYAAYGSFSIDFDKISLKSGLRYEHTITDIKDENELQVVDRNYGNFFPSIFLSRKVSEKVSTNLSYTARITRPQFLQLSPAPKFFEPRTFQTGNTQLLPVFTHTVRTSLTWNRLIASIEYNRINNEIGRQPTSSENSNQVVTTTINFGKSELVAVNLSFPIIVTDWWEMNNNFSAYHKSVESPPDFAIFQTLTTQYAIFNTSQQFKLGKKFTAEISGVYYSGYAQGFMTYNSTGQISVGLRKQFENNGGTLSLNLSDIFKTFFLNSEVITSEGNLVVSRSNNWDSRVVRLTYSKNFGNGKLKSRSKRKGGSAEDLKRL